MRSIISGYDQKMIEKSQEGIVQMKNTKSEYQRTVEKVIGE